MIGETNPSSTVIPTIYLSYYPEDVPDFAPALNAWLSLRLGSRKVISDIQIPPFAESFEFYLREKVTKSDLMLVLIGKKWVQHLHNFIWRGKPDRVRSEIRAALNEGIPVAPLCIDHAPPPREIDLPVDLRPMMQYQFKSLGLERPIEKDINDILNHIQGKLANRRPLISPADFVKLYEKVQQAYHVNDTTSAIKYLKQIQALGEIPRTYRPFKLQIDQVMRDLERRNQQRSAQPHYREIQQMVRQNPDSAWEMLQQFQIEFPEAGDPDHLSTVLCPWNNQTQQLIDQVSNTKCSIYERITAAKALAIAGDPRPGVGLRVDGLPFILWQPVPAGEFIYRYDKRIHLPRFYISRFPISQTQFQVFIESGAYANPYWWEGLAATSFEHYELNVQLANHPRNRVSWVEAVAYSRWLSTQLNLPIRLPTEEEWEKAARGTGGNIYPWGNEYISGYANINESISGAGPHDLRNTTPIGIYPQGVSPYGVAETIGNVWEWCLNQHDNPTYQEITGTEKRALRGGSFMSDKLFAHGVRRRGESPHASFTDIGFRLVVAAESMFR